MVPDFERRHFLNKPIEDITDDELIDALNKCYAGMLYFPSYNIIGIEIRNCYNLYEAELYNRRRKVKLVMEVE